MFSSRMLPALSVALLVVFGSIVSAAPTIASDDYSLTPEGQVRIVDDGGQSDHMGVMKLSGRKKGSYLHLDYYHFQGMLTAQLIVKESVSRKDATQFVFNANNRTLRLEDGRTAVAPATKSELQPSGFNLSSIYFAPLDEINRSNYTVVRCTLGAGQSYLDCTIPESRPCKVCRERSYLQTCPKRPPVYLGIELGVGCKLEHLVLLKKKESDAAQSTTQSNQQEKGAGVEVTALAHGA